MVEQQTQTEFRLPPLEPVSSTCTKAFKITLLGGGLFFKKPNLIFGLVGQFRLNTFIFMNILSFHFNRLIKETKMKLYDNRG